MHTDIEEPASEPEIAEEWFEEKASKAKSAIAHVIDIHVHVDR
jgi:hypothetical protein